MPANLTRDHIYNLMCMLDCFDDWAQTYLVESAVPGQSGITGYSYWFC